jgi:hypothetical protein
VELEDIYSYTAIFEDGTAIVRDCNDPIGDKCLSDPNGANRFTDVLNKEKESKLISFVVHNEHFKWGVDLVEGSFSVNGTRFYQHRPDLDGYKDFRIVWYRTVRRHLDQVTGKEIRAEIIGYGLGWQTTHNGENIKKILFF